MNFKKNKEKETQDPVSYYLHQLMTIIPLLVVGEFIAQVYFFAKGKNFISTVNIGSLTLLVVTLVASKNMQNITSNIKSINFKEEEN